ncbi:hypothetical protein KR49_05750 [Synechococcus sp. KORDI-49]|nr:hypothetical protein KR49_05750 [Synechococcus sp. KORDI-49]
MANQTEVGITEKSPLAHWSITKVSVMDVKLNGTKKRVIGKLELMMLT